MNHRPSSGVALQDGSDRLYYLDWLRALTIGAVFLYHCSRPFGQQMWHIRNAVQSLASTIHVEFFRIWMMPLFFVLSGAAILFSLQRRSIGRFLGERFLRLLVPLVGLGWFVIGPIQIYFERLTYGQFSGSFLEFYPHYFEGFAQFGGNFAWHGMNLWFLLYLFLLSLLWLPWFVPFGKSRKSLLARISPAFSSVAVLLLLTIPFAAADHLVSALDIGFLRGTGGWSFFSYFLLLPIGYMLFSTERAQRSIRRITWLSLGLASIASAVYVMALHVWQVDLTFGSLTYYGLTFARSASALLWIYALLGVGMRYLNTSNRFLKAANEGGLPFYILHQTAIVAIGFLVIQWSLPIAAKYLLIVALACLGTVLPYLLLVRPWNPVRFLFGMRLRKRS